MKAVIVSGKASQELVVSGGLFGLEDITRFDRSGGFSLTRTLRSSSVNVPSADAADSHSTG